MYRLSEPDKIALDTEVKTMLLDGDTFTVQAKITGMEITRDNLAQRATIAWQYGKDWRMADIQAQRIDALIDRAYSHLYTYRARMNG